MSEPVGAMTSAEYEEALRKDLAGTSAEHQAALVEIAKLRARQDTTSMPDAQIAAGWRALRAKFAHLIGR